MSFKATVCERMESVAHNQQFEAPPSSLSGIEAIGVIDLAAKLADNSLDDVGGARHPWMIQMGKEKRYLVLEGKDLPLQPAVLKASPLFLPDLKPEADLFFGSDIEDSGDKLHEGLNSSTRSRVEIAEVIVEELLHMAHAELERDTGKDLLAGTPHSPIPVNNQAFEGVTDLVLKASKHGLPGQGPLVSDKASQGDILSGGISTEQQRVVLALNEDGFPIEQEVATPRRLKLLGHLDEALTIKAQGIGPLKSVVGAHMQLSSHSSVGGFPIEVEMSGAQDEARCHRCSRSITGSRKGTPALMTPPAANLACPQPLSCTDRDPVDRVPFGM